MSRRQNFLARPGASLLIVLLAASAGAVDVPFGPQNLISSIAGDAFTIAAGDVDGDGDADLFTASFDDKVAWYENDGSGGFGAQLIISTAHLEPVDVFPADIDGDGKLDVLAASIDDDKIVWYRNADGLGGFGAQLVISTAMTGPSSVFAADLDSDGDLDVLAAAFGSSPEIAWFENSDGLGSFAARQTITTAAFDPFDVIAADLDGDGDLDVASATRTDDEIAWYENTDGQGSFGAQQSVTVDAFDAMAVRAADLDGDGDLDLVSASETDDKIAWYENTDGAGSFGAQQVVGTAGDRPLSVEVADADADGDLDIFAVSVGDDELAWYENTDGAGNFGAQRVIATASFRPTSLVLADLDGDGDLDPATCSQGDNEVAWYENESIHRSASFPTNAPVTGGTDGTMAVAVGDLDGDGDLDILSASFDDDELGWFRNTDGAGSFAATPLISGTADGARDIVAADIDGDGDLDAIGASQLDDTIAWYANDGAGGFGAASTISSAATGAAAVAVADLDGDGDLDVISASSEIAWHENSDGAGSFAAASTISAAITTGSDVLAADFDGDGDPDVASASVGDDRIAWYANDGTGSFGGQVVIATSSLDPQALAALDVDGDGDLDLVAASQADDKLAWFENSDGAGSFGAEQVISSLAGGARAVVGADLDADGDVDLAVAAFDGDEISWYANGGAGSFAPAALVAESALGAAALAAGDVDADGRLDLISGTRDGNQVRWYPNGGGQFALATADISAANYDGGATAAILQIEASHRGRAGDADVEIASFELLFEEAPGDPLSSAEADALIDELRLWEDDGSGAFESGSDSAVGPLVTSLALTSGLLTIPISDADADFQLSPGASRTYFLVLTFTANGGDQVPNTFRVTHLTESSSTAEDADHDIPLLLEFAADVATPTIAVVGGCDDGVDNDGDGLIDLADPGCDDAQDASELSPVLQCDNGIDDDSDGEIDFGSDIGCVSLTGVEAPPCQDGIDNDNDGTVDFDGGRSVNGGVPLAAADPTCHGLPTRDRERRRSGCGLGAELALLLPLCMAVRRRRRRRGRA